MGNYITSALLTERVGSTLLDQLINITDSTAKAAAIASVIKEAEGEVDGYLSVVYSTPVPSNGLIESLCLDIAERILYKRSSFPSIPEKIKDSYERASSLLEKVATGKMAIPATGMETSDAGGPMLFEGDDDIYTEEDMQGF